MRIVVALGGNALLRRGDLMTTEVQRKNVAIAAEAIAPLTAEHDIADALAAGKDWEVPAGRHFLAPGGALSRPGRAPRQRPRRRRST